VRSNAFRMQAPSVDRRRAPSPTPVEKLGRLGLAVVWVVAESLIFLDGFGSGRSAPASSRDDRA
jgi:hypothetical protein